MQRSRWSSLAVLVALLAPAANAQTPEATVPPPATVVPRRTLSWSLFDMLGYAGVGGGVGTLAGGASGAGFVTGAAVGALFGGMVGAGIGSSAEKAAREGQAMNDGHRALAVAGVAFAGGSVGALTAVLLINPHHDTVTSQDNDTQTALLCVGTGVLLGGWYASRHAAELGGGELTVAPQRRGVDGRTRYDVGMRFSF